MRLLLHANGLPGDWVSYTPLGGGGSNRSAIVSGSLPAALLSPDDVLMLRDTDALRRGHMIVDLAQKVRAPHTGAVVSDKLLATNPDLVRRYLRATLKGQRFMRAYPQQTKELIKAYQPKMDDYTLDFLYRETIDKQTEGGEMSAADLRRDMEVRATVLSIAPDKVRPVDDAYDYRLLRQARAELDGAGWKPVP
jgi:NitT/TauT family transport system substrate-binding protein